jgi:lysophospholipase L1-like esterase
MNRILLLGDSLGVPRPYRGQPIDATWPVLLKLKFTSLDIWQRCRAASYSHDILKEFHCFSDSISAFDLVVVQVGIGDCCPRPFPLFFHYIFQTCLSAKANKKINSWYPFLQKIRSKPWISVDLYIRRMKEIADLTLERNPNASVVFIRIGTPCHGLLAKAPGVERYVERYNSALEQLCRSYGEHSRVSYLDPYLGYETEKLFIDDGHHLTVLGHQAVAKALTPWFEQICSYEPNCQLKSEVK